MNRVAIRSRGQLKIIGTSGHVGGAGGGSTGSSVRDEGAERYSQMPICH
jgi:hypothetical protein